MEDSIPISENLYEEEKVLVELAETLDIVESIELVSEYYNELLDLLSIQEQISKLSELEKSDTVLVEEAVSISIVLNLADTLNITESVVEGESYVREFSDTLSIIENIVKSITKPLTSVLPIADGGVIGTIELSLSDSLSLTEDVTTTFISIVGLGERQRAYSELDFDRDIARSGSLEDTRQRLGTSRSVDLKQVLRSNVEGTI